jgi:hypothetical protein
MTLHLYSYTRLYQANEDINIETQEQVTQTQQTRQGKAHSKRLQVEKGDI